MGAVRPAIAGLSKDFSSASFSAAHLSDKGLLPQIEVTSKEPLEQALLSLSGIAIPEMTISQTEMSETEMSETEVPEVRKRNVAPQNIAAFSMAELSMTELRLAAGPEIVSSIEAQTETIAAHQLNILNLLPGASSENIRLLDDSNQPLEDSKQGTIALSSPYFPADLPSILPDNPERLTLPLAFPQPQQRLAAPHNFNPDLWQGKTENPAIETTTEPSVAPSNRLLTQPSEPLEVDLQGAIELETIPAVLGEQPQKPAKPWFSLKDIQFNFGDDLSNFGQGKQINEPVLYGKLWNGTSVVLAPGYNTFELPDYLPVTNIPLKFGWQEKIQDIPISIMGGIDTFDRLRPAPYLKLSSTIPLRQRAVLSFEVEHSLYKFNVETLEKGISAWRYGPSLFWQMGKHTTLFSMARWGRYSDGNREQQSFSRIEHKRGEFSAAANMFNWRYREDYVSRSGYFSPDDFLVATGELAWEKRMFRFLKCRLSGALGKQRAGGAWSNAYSYDALCTVKPFDNLEFDIGYSLGNVLDRVTGDSAYNNRSIKGQVRITN